MATNDNTTNSTSHVAPHVAPVVVPTAYKKLVVMLAHMFYNGQCPPAWWVDASEPKKQMSQAEAELAMFQEKKASQLAREAKRKAQQDTTGLGIILLTALAERQWVEEEDLARNLNLPPKMVRKAMRFFEQEQIVQREHRKETKRGRKKEREMLLAGGLMQAAGEEEEEEVAKGHVITYCSLDFPRMYDTVRWRLEMMKKNLEREAKSKTGDMKYKCPNQACGKVFQQMDVFNLMPGGSRALGGFGAFGAAAADASQQLTCDICGTEIEMLVDEEGTTMGTMQDKRERQRKAKVMLEQFDEVMRPLQNQLLACEASQPPDFTSYTSWLTAAVDMQKRLTFINNNENAVAARVGPSQRRPEITQDTKVTVSIGGGETATQSFGGLGGLTGAAAGAAATAAAGVGGRVPEAAGLPRAGGGPAAAKPLPPWLQSKVTSNPSQPASKPFPPFLVSAHKQQQQQQPALLQDQVKAEAQDFKEFGVKQDFGVKDEVKLDGEGVIEDWIEVQPGAGEAAAAAGDGNGDADAAAVEDVEDWEDVV